MTKQSEFDAYCETFRALLAEKKRKIMFAGEQFHEYSNGAWDRITREQWASLKALMLKHARLVGFPWSKERAALEATLQADLTPEDTVTFDSEPMIVGPTRTLFLIDDAQRPHNPDHYATRRVNVEVDSDAKCPEWLKMLNRVFSDMEAVERTETIDFLQEWFGISIIRGSLPRDLKKGLILIGPASTGKTTISEVLRLLLGPNRVVAPSLQSLRSEFGRELLLGASALVADDGVGLDALADANVMKHLVTGETMTVNRKHQM